MQSPESTQLIEEPEECEEHEEPEEYHRYCCACRWWDDDAPEVELYFGLCRREAPQAHMDDTKNKEDSRGRWPITNCGDWCGCAEEKLYVGF
jgi:hypothetical protein